MIAVERTNLDQEVERGTETTEANLLFEKFRGLKDHLCEITQKLPHSDFEAGEYIIVFHVEQTPTGKICLWYQDRDETIDFYYPNENDFNHIEKKSEEPDNPFKHKKENCKELLDALQSPNQYFISTSGAYDRDGLDPLIDVLSNNNITTSLTRHAGTASNTPHIQFGSTTLRDEQDKTHIAHIQKGHARNPNNPVPDILINPPDPAKKKERNRYSGTNETRFLEILFKAGIAESSDPRNQKLMELWPNLMRIAITRAKLLERRIELIPQNVRDLVQNLDLEKNPTGIKEIRDTLQDHVHSWLYNLVRMPNIAYELAGNLDTTAKFFGKDKAEPCDFDNDWLRKTSILTHEQTQLLTQEGQQVDNRSEWKKLVDRFVGTKKEEKRGLRNSKSQQELQQAEARVVRTYQELPQSLARFRYQAHVLQQSPTIRERMKQINEQSVQEGKKSLYDPEIGFLLKPQPHPVLGETAICINGDKDLVIPGTKNMTLRYSPTVMQDFIGTPGMPDTQIQFHTTKDKQNHPITVGWELYSPHTNGPEKVEHYLTEQKNASGRVYRKLKQIGQLFSRGKHFVGAMMENKLDRQALSDQYIRDPEKYADVVERLDVLQLLDKLGFMEDESVHPDFLKLYQLTKSTRFDKKYHE